MGLFDKITAPLSRDEPLPPGAREEIDLALELCDRDAAAEAEHRLETLARAAPRAAPVHVALGQVRARRGDDEGAVQAFGRAVDLNRDAVDAWLGLGEALVRLDRRDPARDALRRVLTLASDPERRARAHAARGRLALGQRAHARAIRELRRAAELRPEDLRLCGELGTALLHAGDAEGWSWLVRGAPDPALDPEVAIEAAAQAPDPEVGESLLRRALEARQTAAAKTRASTGVPTDPRPQARLEAALARHLARRGRHEDALGVAQAAAARTPDEPAVHEALREVHARAGRPDEALEAALRARAAGGDGDPATLLPLALAVGTREALARLRHAVAPDHPLSGALRAIAEGTAREDDIVALGPLAGSAAARAALARTLSPGAPPPDNLYGLLSFAHTLVAQAHELGPLLPYAGRALEAFDRPLLVAVMGEFNAGKSSFVNALVGAEVAPVGVTPTTATINVLRHGPPGGRVLYHDGRVRELPAEEVGPFLRAVGDEDAGAVRSVELFFPLEFLRRVEIVDTPGLNSLRPEHEAVARGYLVEADAIVWLFAAGQAAKATERDALGLAHAAGKRVLGVLSKADQVAPEEMAAIVRHVEGTLGDRVEALLPLSARRALAAGQAGDADALARSGLPALLAALEDRFFSSARALKRQTALGALDRLVQEAQALLAAGDASVDAPAGAPRSEPVNATGAAGSESAPVTPDERRRALDAAEAAVRGALAAERVALRARVESGFRQAVGELLELLRPRSWPFGDRRADSGDQELLFDMLEDVILGATETTRAALTSAAAGGPPLPIAEAIDRYRAFARGVLTGGLVERFLGEDLPAAGARLELATLQRALMRRFPDADPELLRPLEARLAATYAEARRRLDEEIAVAEIRRLARRERLDRPLEAIAAGIATLRAAG